MKAPGAIFRFFYQIEKNSQSHQHMLVKPGLLDGAQVEAMAKTKGKANNKNQSKKRQTALAGAACGAIHCHKLPPHYVVYSGPACQWNAPMRLRLPKFIQTKKALPTIFPSGTNPQ